MLKFIYSKQLPFASQRLKLEDEWLSFSGFECNWLKLMSRYLHTNLMQLTRLQTSMTFLSCLDCICFLCKFIMELIENDTLETIEAFKIGIPGVWKDIRFIIQT